MFGKKNNGSSPGRKETFEAAAAGGILPNPKEIPFDLRSSATGPGIACCSRLPVTSSYKS